MKELIQSAGVAIGGLIGGKLFMNAQSFFYEFMQGFNPYGNLIGALSALLIIKILQWAVAKFENKFYRIKDDTNSKKKQAKQPIKGTVDSKAHREPQEPKG